ncbi:MAG: flavodoxin family protein [Clostridiales bacterium]|jgi:NAD(P)H dehydrogenase (quinone)|nr:flavodoxin family protein [Clostridiales bacterium]HOK81407.1 NAD(P)H-dependent oxidoreductase [Clostridia bacterium]HOL60707.1 NAD(P)H-dependent oxidoreductase [Clostridia bacterium]HPO53282.1 NAD(P)H-dependent oxidoreductase [Clostridia bacterium]
MKTVIVYYHPYNKSYCRAILEAAKQGAMDAGREADVIDLSADSFNPVMGKEDLQGFVRHEIIDPKAKEYFDRIKGACHLIFIFPIWWGNMPAMVKGFIDKVVFPGSFYEQDNSGKVIPLLPNLKVTIFATMNTPAPIYKLYFGNQVYNAMKKSVFGFAGIKDVKFVPFGTVKAVSASKREKWLKKAARIAGER